MDNPIPVPAKETEHDPLLTEAISALHAGERERAHDILALLVKQRPDHRQAWLWLATLSTDLRQARAYARTALRLDPQNRRVVRAVRQIEARMAPRQAYPHLARRWLGVWLPIVALVAILCFAGQVWALKNGNGRAAEFVPTAQPYPTYTPTPTPTPTPNVPKLVGERMPHLQQAWETREWQRAIDVLNEVASLDPQYPGLDTARCDTYLHWAGDMVTEGQIKRVYELYLRARSYCGERADVEGERSLALTYLSGKWRYDQRRWQSAATALQAVYDVRPDYAQTQSLLYTSYISASHELLAESDLQQAQQAAEAALAVEPDRPEAQALVDEIHSRDKRIEVDISEQRMYVWQGDTLVYKWLTSTGEPGRGTASGHYSVLDKIPMAWASTWSLKMPYWLGIYWVGTMENGIHALPINPDGSILWAGWLGTPVSYGCVILSTENARTLFDWAPIGTPVWIHY